jgi:6-pyruvoyltetrahydropterin/6-carboxytetrahydropterin synthase
MYELTVTRTFSAAHAIVLGGEREPLHGHDWEVRVVVAGEMLDDEGLLCDFHALEEAVDAAIAPLHNTNLSDVPELAKLNPTAEIVARHIGVAVKATLPAGVRLHGATVTEAPGCAATWRPSADG